MARMKAFLEALLDLRRELLAKLVNELDLTPEERRLLRIMEEAGLTLDALTEYDFQAAFMANLQYREGGEEE